MTEFRVETDSMGEVRVPAHALWGAQTQRSLEYFSIGRDRMPPEMVAAYATLRRPPPSPTTPAGGSMTSASGSSRASRTRSSMAATTPCSPCGYG